jgi:hypothetical protein
MSHILEQKYLRRLRLALAVNKQKALRELRAKQKRNKAVEARNKLKKHQKRTQTGRYAPR